MKRLKIVTVLMFCAFYINAQDFSGYKNAEIINNEKYNIKTDTFFSVTHSLSQNINTGTSVSCNANGIHYENSYYRVFDLYNYFNLNSDWSVQQVEVGIAIAESGTGTTQPAELRLYVMSEYNGNSVTLDSLHLQRNISFDINNNESGTIKSISVNPAVSVPFGTVLVAEVFIPDGQEDNNMLFIGSNNEGQTDNTYIRAPQCGVENPVNLEEIGYGDMHLVMNVIGAYNAAVPEVLSFNIEGQLLTTEIINEPDYTIKVVMPADTSLKALAPEISVPLGFYISPQSGVIVDFSSGPVEYFVTNEYTKVIRSWFASVKNAGPDIIDVAIPNQNGETIIDSINYQITVPVPFGTDLTNIAPAITIYDGFIINPEAGTSQDFSTAPVIYTVSHETLPLTQDWEIAVIEAASSDIDIINSEFKVYPNPAKDFIQITGPGSIKIEFYNISGKQFLSSNKKKINISNIPNGIYLLKIQTSEGQIIKKISVIK
ncbi:MAG: T9SS type A sorting domain-containing protein [Bacteroidales bacterium]|nr:T9SS type A sorting domain-containing protein [Bacteroidales bacterium]